MKRQDKYPDTRYFKYHNQNPKNRITGDCWARAVSKATEVDYNKVVMEMAELQCRTGFDASSSIGRYLEGKGWKRFNQPRKINNTKYTGKEFCKEIQEGRFTNLLNKNIVANIGGHHVVAICKGKIYDIWDSTDGCIGNYWIKDN